MNNLAVALRRRGKLDEAVRMQERVVELRAAALPATHFEQAGGMANLATCHVLAGRGDLALPLVRKALEGRLATLGPSHPATGRTRYVLGSAFLAVGAVDGARAELLTALEIQRVAYSTGHWQVVDVQLELARLENEAGRPDEASAWANAVLDALAPPPAVATAAAREQQALADWRRGDSRAAESRLLECLALRRELLGDDHPETAEVVCMSGALRALRAPCEGEPATAPTEAEVTESLAALADAERTFASSAASAPWRAALARVIADELRRRGGREPAAVSRKSAAMAVLEAAPVRWTWWAHRRRA